MRLSTATIRNFRGIKELTIQLHSFTTLIGKNNSGKSSAIRAINMALSNQKPQIDDWPGKNAENPIEVEMFFDDLKQWERAKPGISGLVYNEGVHLKYIATFDPEKSKVTCNYLCKKQQEKIVGWADKWGELSAEIQELAKKLGIANQTQFKTKVNQEKIREEIRQSVSKLIEVGPEEWTDEGISIESALQQAIPMPIEIPAVLDPTEEASVAAKTAFGRLVNSILIPALEKTQEFKNLSDAVDALQTKITSQDQKLVEVRELEAQLTKSISAIFPARINLEMEDADLSKAISAAPILRIEDGVKTPIQNQGHGVQRSVIFSLIETLGRQAAKFEGEGGHPNHRATILLFEEPELFLHPHLMRRMRDALKVISQTDQVHVTQLSSDPFQGKDGERETLRAMLNFHPTVCEAFFATRTVLVEGNSELAILNHSSDFIQKYGIHLEEIRETTIVSCAGKWTIIPMARLLSEFGIEYRVIHDQDLDSRTPEQLALITPIDPYSANARIVETCGAERVFVVNDTLEHILFAPGTTSKKDKPFKCWKRAEELAGNDEERSTLEDLKSMVEFAFKW
jgi:predicted ATP-dependent endonuclease of OLD family